MKRELFLFEMRYRLGRPTTLVYVGAGLLFSFLAVASPTLEIPSLVDPNAPYVIALILVAISFISSLVNSAIMGVSVVRDYEHQMESLIFSCPINKGDYLFGRFSGSVLVLVLVSLASLLGVWLGFSVGGSVPWEISWAGASLQPFRPGAYLQPFLLFALPNLFITSCLFFAAGTLGRHPIFIYTQGIVFIVLYQLGGALFQNMESAHLAALLDPLGLRAFALATRYWSPHELNTYLVPPAGWLLLNRVLWIGVGLLTLWLTYVRFSLTPTFRRNKKKDEYGLTTQALAPQANGAVKEVTPVAGSLLTDLKLLGRKSLFYFRLIVKDRPFTIIVVSGLLLFVVRATQFTEAYGTSTYPTTHAILKLLDSFNLFLLLLAIIYPGELIWKERQLRVDALDDSLPTTDYLGMLAKFTGLVMTLALVAGTLLLAGLAIQAGSGYLDLHPGALAGKLLGEVLVTLTLVSIVSFLIHVMVNNKFFGYVFTVVFFLINGYLPSLGVQSPLLQLGAGGIEMFSDMNGFGHQGEAAIWVKLYWLAVAGILLQVAILFSMRGNESSVAMRWKAARDKVSGPMLLCAALLFMVAFFCGGTVYYNTNVVNHPDAQPPSEGASKVPDSAAWYTGKMPQPSIVENTATIDIYPSSRDFAAEGYYYLKNLTEDTVREISVSYHPDPDLRVDYVQFDRNYSGPVQPNEGTPYYVYRLRRALLPGDSVKMDYRLHYITSGFKMGLGNTDIVYNGTYMTQDYLPAIGAGLQSLPEAAGDRGLAASGDRPAAAPVRLNLTVSTDAGQRVVGPGRLVREWTSNGRQLYQYRSEKAVPPPYAVTSARLQQLTDQQGDINLEIYSHPAHGYNLDRMMEGMKEALAYGERLLGPYPYSHLRIVEHTGYTEHRSTFAGVIPFSERMAFTFKAPDDAADLDVCYYQTVHETAHQWWGRLGHRGMLIELLAQYQALMMLRQEFDEATVERFLKFELEQYLEGRSKRKEPEVALIEASENQSYIYYNKSMLAFRALNYFAGDSLAQNTVTQFYGYHKSHSGDGSEMDFYHLLVQNTPDSLRSLVRELFGEVVVYSNKASAATYRPLPDGRFEVSFSFVMEKHQTDSLGNEEQVPAGGWVPVGLYGRKNGGEEKILFLKDMRVVDGENQVTMIVEELPARAAIDPGGILIDINGKDNSVEVVEPGSLKRFPF